MIIMRGLPASGKSSKAKQMVNDTGNCVRINKDLLRTMLHFDRFTFKNEDLTRDAARTLAKMFLEKNINVIIDDTNLHAGTLQSWKDLAKESKAKIAYGDCTGVDINECIKRDAIREKKVGKDVIINMALRSGLYKIPGPIVICDLDGTLCNIDHRLHFVKDEKKDWKSFYDHLHLDPVNEKVLTAIKYAHRGGCSIVFVSGRPDTCKEATLAWLAKNKINFFTTLIMRGAHDHRPDDEVKKDIITQHFDLKDIATVIDDRPRVIRMWKELGLNVVDVGHGIEF